MPVPEPHSGETQDQFIGRCMSQLADEDPDRPNQQRLAMCFSQWRDRLGIEALHPDFMRILKLFVTRYGEDGGLLKFESFLKANKLDPSKVYSPAVQFREDFQWVAPLIHKYREDRDAKYYLIRCLTANISMNNRNYEDWDKMQQAAPSLSYRPVNIDHFHNGTFTGPESPGGWLSYPRTRMDFTKADDLSVEGTLRVDNHDQLFQKMLDHDPSIPEEEWIVHPSIEGRPNVGGSTPQEGYHFTGISFLRKGRKLPGDPLTEIYPLMLHEALSESIQATFVDRMENEGEREMELNEYTTPPPSQQPEVPIQCNQCGWTINRPTIDKEEITCPSCGTKGQFTLKPVEEEDPTDNFTNNEAMLEEFLTALEAIPEESRAEFEYIEVAGFPDGRINAPDVRTLLEKLSNETLPEAFQTRLTAILELFKPPHGGTAQTGDPNAASPDGVQVDLEPAAIPTVGAVDGVTIGLVEANQKIAELTEKNLSLTKTVGLRTTELSLLREEKASLEEKLAQKDRLLSTGDKIKAHASEMIEKLAEEEAAHVGTKATLTSEQDAHLRTKARLMEANKEIKAQELDLAKVKDQREKIRTELNENLTKRAASDQNSINETKARSRIQEENADLREEVAKLTRRVSDLTTARSREAGDIMANEKEIAGLKETNGKLEEMVRGLNDDLRLQRRLSNNMNKKLKAAGFVEMDAEGNIKL